MASSWSITRPPSVDIQLTHHLLQLCGSQDQHQEDGGYDVPPGTNPHLPVCGRLQGVDGQSLLDGVARKVSHLPGVWSAVGSGVPPISPQDTIQHLQVDCVESHGRCSSSGLRRLTTVRQEGKYQCPMPSCLREKKGEGSKKSLASVGSLDTNTPTTQWL